MRERPAQLIADVLLNQRVMAGIGNVYKSEVLFGCGVNPFTPVAGARRRQVDVPDRHGRKFLLANVHTSLAPMTTYAGYRRTRRGATIRASGCGSTAARVFRAAAAARPSGSRSRGRGAPHLLVPEVPGGIDRTSGWQLQLATDYVHLPSSGLRFSSAAALRRRRLYGHYLVLPAWLTGPEICQLEAGGCAVLFRTPRARLLGVPNASLGVLLYALLATGWRSAGRRCCCSR